MSYCKFCHKNKAVEQYRFEFCSKDCLWAFKQKEYLIKEKQATKEELDKITNPALMPLSEAQKEFVYEYVRTKNIVKAYREAFPSSKNYNNKEVYKKGTFLLSLPFVKTYINEVVDEMKNRFIEDKFGVMVTLDTIINASIKDFLNPDGSVKAISEIDDQRALAVKKYTRRYHKNGELMEESIELEDKMKAIGLVGKYYQLFVDRKEVDVKVTHLLDVIKSDSDVDIEKLIEQAKASVENKVKERSVKVLGKEPEIIDTKVVDDDAS